MVSHAEHIKLTAFQGLGEAGDVTELKLASG
jgi:hypothetical protein